MSERERERVEGTKGAGEGQSVPEVDQVPARQLTFCTHLSSPCIDHPTGSYQILSWKSSNVIY